jgi:hypothetical protein
MRRTIGGNAQDRRRARRAASRRQTNGLSDQDVRDIQTMIAAASGSTDLPLSDQDTAWDSGAAVKTLDPADFPKAYFWKDPDGDATTKAAFKLPFASKASGKLMAIWRGVTAAAGAVQGARGGVSIPSGDVGAVKARIAGYYADAAKKFNDPSIKPPWEGNESAGETAAFLLAYAECAGTLSRSPVETDIQFAWYSMYDEGAPVEDRVAVYFADEETFEAFEERLAYWEAEFGDDPDEGRYAAIATYIDAVLADPHMLGGPPSKGTKKDKRLKGNNPGGDTNNEEGDQPEDDNMSVQPYDESVGVGLAALEAVEELAASVKCGCGHAYSEHSGAGGTCGHEDGRGTCRCGEFAYPEADVAALAAAIVELRPDFAGQEEAVGRVAERMLLALEAAAGDVAWGPEDGFVDLLCDLNEILEGQAGSKGFHYDGDEIMYGGGPRAVDVSVKLDKTLICDGDDKYVAPITIDGQGEPMLSDRSDWIHVEKGFIETPEDGDDSMQSAATQMRFALRDIVMTATTTADLAPEAVEVIPEKSDEITPPTANANGEIPWTATFVPEGILTEDGRAFAPGSIILPPDEQARQLPLTLMGLIETSAEGGHDRAKVAGRIDNMWREDDTSKVKASGVFSNEEWGAMIARMVESKELTGLSVDIAPLEYEHVNRSDWFNEKGEWTAVQGEDGEWAPANGATMQEPESLEEWLNADLVLAITKAVIGMATVCPFPAFGAAEISLAASGLPRTYTGPLDLQFDCGCTPVEVAYVTVPAAVEGEVEVLTAAAAGLAPVAPPAEWFADPEFTEPTAMTITDEGHIFGHAWQWNTCHLSFDQCVTAPKTETNYAYYMLGEIACDDGERLAVGKITMDTGHAGTRLSRVDATAHYDNTGTVAAHVQFGEDEFGGWFSGAISPELSEEKVRLLRGATVSGDWRGVDGNLELVGLLACNVPGFPVPRSLQASVVVVDDEPVIQALVAAGIVTLGLEADIAAMVNEVTEPVEA